MPYLVYALFEFTASPARAARSACPRLRAYRLLAPPHLRFNFDDDDTEYGLTPPMPRRWLLTILVDLFMLSLQLDY